jgi:diguanylate cyclase (GGDEF)-like protein
MTATYEKIRQLNEQAWLNRNKNVQYCLKMAQEAQELIENSAEASKLDLALSLRAQGYCLDHLSRYSDALKTTLKAIELANQLGDLRLVASIDNVLGNIYLHLADFSSSLDHYMHGLRVMEIQPNPEEKVFLLQGLGVLYYEIEDYEEALKYFKRSIETVLPINVTGRAIGLNNIAYTLYVMKRNEEALPYALEAMDLYGDEPFSVGKLELMHTLGSIYMRMGEIERALSYFEEVVQEAEHQEYSLQMINALLGICQIHQLRGEMDDALKKLLRVLQISRDIDSPSSECSVREHLSRLYKQMGNYQTALEHYEAFHSLHVQIFNEQAERRLRNTRMLLEVESIQKEANLYRNLAATDGLTGLLSRREFFDLGGKVVSQARLRQAQLSLLMVDLDNFKAINDQSGHSVGDQVLSIVARRIRSVLRQDDLAGRYGGDEFVILMPKLGLPECQRIAKRCQNVVSEEPIEIDSFRFWINISIGLVTSEMASPLYLEELIQHADQALLQAKRDGRNRIICSVLP